MKKLSVIIAALLLLTGCSVIKSPVPSNSEEISSSSEVESVEDRVENGLIEENGNLIVTTKTGISQLYLQEKISENCFTYLINFVSGGNIYDGISVSDYKITYNDKKYTEEYSFEFEYSITESNYPNLEVGKHTDTVMDVVDIYAYPAGTDIKEREIPEKIQNEPAVKTVLSLLGTYNMTPVIYGKGHNYSDVSQYLTIRYGSLPIDKFKQLAYEKFGIEPHEPLYRELYVTDDGMVIEGGIGGATSYELISCEKDKSTGDSLVRVQFYADYSYRIPSSLIEYRISSDERFLDMQTIEFQSSYHPYGFMSRISGHNIPFTDVDEYVRYAKAKNEDDTLCEFVAAFLKNDSAKVQEMMMDSQDEDITRQLSKIKCKPENQIIYVNPENTVNVMVSMELECEKDAMGRYTSGYNTYYFSEGLFPYVISEAYYYGASNRVAVVDWIKQYLEPVAKKQIFQMPSKDTLGLHEFILSRLALQNPNEDSFTQAQISDYAKKYLSVDDYIVPEKSYMENGKYVFPARCGNSIVHMIAGVEGTREYPEIIVQFYADVNELVKSHTVKYTLRLMDGEYALKDVAVINKANIEPFGWSM